MVLGMGGHERTQSPWLSWWHLFQLSLSKEDQGYRQHLSLFLSSCLPFSHFPAQYGSQSDGGVWAGGREGAGQGWREIEG